MQAASESGKAAQAAFQALRNRESAPILENSDVSQQEVFLLPQEGVVFKHSNERAEEEERLVNDLFDLMSEQAVVGTFHLHKASAKQFGIEVSGDVQARGVRIQDLSPALLDCIKEKLSGQDQLILEQNKDNQALYLCPNLSDPGSLLAYEMCEQYKWNYTDEAGERKEVDFKKAHLISIEHGTYVNPIPKEDRVPDNWIKNQALNISWKTVGAPLMKLASTGVTELTDIYAKPFISDMLLMQNLQGPVKREILDRLTPDAEFNAILTGELQLLDLHAGNLGVTPSPNPNYERFKNTQFSTRPLLGAERKVLNNVNFNTLICHYLEGKIQPDTVIEFTEEGKIVQLPLKDLPELQKALDTPWQFVIFDTDLSLSEDNRLQLQMRGGRAEHLIPFRSILLETDWKDRPLSDTVIQRLMSSTERDHRVEHWIKKTDAPIYQRLSEEIRKSIQQQVAPFLEKYSLSEKRERDEETTVKRLRDEFVEELCLINEKTVGFWTKLQKQLKEDEALDLSCAESKVAMDKRRWIAAQLFPRMTQKQQNALFERQDRRNKYLSHYQTLSSS